MYRQIGEQNDAQEFFIALRNGLHEGIVIIGLRTKLDRKIL